MKFSCSAHLDSLAKLQLPEVPASVQSLFLKRPSVQLVSWKAESSIEAVRAPTPRGLEAANPEDGEVDDAEEVCYCWWCCVIMTGSG